MLKTEDTAKLVKQNNKLRKELRKFLIKDLEEKIDSLYPLEEYRGDWVPGPYMSSYDNWVHHKERVMESRSEYRRKVMLKHQKAGLL